MARHLPRKLLPLAAIVLLLACQHSVAQLSSQPSAPPPMGGGGPQKPPEPAPPAKELSPEEINALIEKAFGRDCPELKRPVRAWLAEIGMIVVADKATVAPDGHSVRFTSARASNLSAEANDLRGDEIVVFTQQPIKKAGDLHNRSISVIEVHTRTSIVTLTPGSALFTGFGVSGTIVVRGGGGGSGGGGRSTAFFGSKIVEEPKKPLPPMIINDGTASTIPLEVLQEFTGRSLGIRFKFNIDPKASLNELLPTPPKSTAKLPHWTNEDLTKVPELTFGEPIAKDQTKHKATEATAHAMAKANHLNAKKTDGFMLAMIEQRGDLRGLPFLMGDDCRTQEEQAVLFGRTVENIHATFRQAKANTEGQDRFWALMGESNQSAQMQPSHLKNNTPRFSGDLIMRTKVAALMQILMPESAEIRLGLAKFLATVPHPDATRALARLAIFSAEDEVRAAAIAGLKLRREKDYTDVLMQGFRYPLPAVSKRSAEALVKLERKDLLANLVDVLESPDPRLPVTEKRDGKEVSVVRELVKINHHRNCMLCHAPGNTDNTPAGVLKVAVPLTIEPLPSPQDGGGYQSTPQTPDIVVRLDMTYLRQDFSQMMAVSEPHPWPAMQRFDFLVRTRTLTAAESQAYEPCCEADEPGRLSPYHRSALYALRELTGRDTEPTAAAWRKLLKLAAR